MDYENKYKELVDAVKVLRDNNPSDEGIQNWVKDNVPELQEDEDELAWLKRYVEEEAYYVSMDIRGNEDRIKLKNLQRSLAWLEKQGEQKPQGKTALEAAKEEKIDNQNCVKPVDKVEPIFKPGDWVINTITNNVEQILKLTSSEYICSGRLIVSFDNQHLLRKWRIQDAKPGDILASKDKADILIFRSLDTSKSFSSYYNIKGIGEGGWSTECFVPATKEQRKQLEKAMANIGYKWNQEKLKLEEI